jgi:protein-tyrosine phosphatase
MRRVVVNSGLRPVGPQRLSVSLLCAMLLASASVHSLPASAQAVATVVAAPSAVAETDRRLVRLEGAANVRSFEGLRGAAAAIPADSFIRAADLNRLSAADRDALAARGVSLNIDLRTAEEAASAPDLLASDQRFGYSRISLLGSEKLDMASLPTSLGDLYVRSLADNKPQYRQVFEAMARQDSGTVLFHCTAGKDRTGMISALLLSLAGVERGQIVANYAESERNLGASLKMTPQMAEMIEKNPRIAALMGSPPEAIESFLDSLERDHGGVRAYFREIGVNDLDVERLLRRLGQRP